MGSNCRNRCTGGLSAFTRPPLRLHNGDMRQSTAERHVGTCLGYLPVSGNSCTLFPHCKASCFGNGDGLTKWVANRVQLRHGVVHHRCCARAVNSTGAGRCSQSIAGKANIVRRV